MKELLSITIYTQYAQIANPGGGIAAFCVEENNRQLYEALEISAAVTNHVAALWAIGAGLGWLTRNRANANVKFCASLLSALSVAKAVQAGECVSDSTPQKLRERLAALLRECADKDLHISFAWQRSAENPAALHASKLLAERNANGVRQRAA